LPPQRAELGDTLGFQHRVEKAGGEGELGQLVRAQSDQLFAEVL